MLLIDKPLTGVAELVQGETEEGSFRFLSRTFRYAIASVTTANPAVVTTTTPNCLKTGDKVWIWSTGCYEAKGGWPITVLSTTTFTIPTQVPNPLTGGNCAKTIDLSGFVFYGRIYKKGEKRNIFPGVCEGKLNSEWLTVWSDSLSEISSLNPKDVTIQLTIERTPVLDVSDVIDTCCGEQNYVTSLAQKPRYRKDLLLQVPLYIDVNDKHFSYVSETDKKGNLVLVPDIFVDLDYGGLNFTIRSSLLEKDNYFWELFAQSGNKVECLVDGRLQIK